MFFNNLDSMITIRIGVFRMHPWPIVDVVQIEFITNMDSIFTKRADWIF